MILVLASATVYYALVASGAITLGNVPGNAPAGEGLAFRLGVLALLSGMVLALLGAVRPAPVWPLPLLAPVGAAFALARFLSYDPYYLPTLRRMSDHGLVSPLLVGALIILALLAGWLSWRLPRAGLLLTAALLPLLTVTAQLMSGGH